MGGGLLGEFWDTRAWWGCLGRSEEDCISKANMGFMGANMGDVYGQLKSWEWILFQTRKSFSLSGFIFPSHFLPPPPSSLQISVHTAGTFWESKILQWNWPCHCNPHGGWRKCHKKQVLLNVMAPASNIVPSFIHLFNSHVWASPVCQALYRCEDYDKGIVTAL